MSLRGRYEGTPIKRLENVRQIRGVDSHTMIRDTDLDFLAAQSVLGESCLNADPALFAAVLQCVRDQILQALRKGWEIASNLRQVRLRFLFHLKPGFLNQPGRIGKRRIDYFRDFERPQTIPLMPLPDRRKEKNLLHH